MNLPLPSLAYRPALRSKPRRLHTSPTCWLPSSLHLCMVLRQHPAFIQLLLITYEVPASGIGTQPLMQQACLVLMGTSVQALLWCPNMVVLLNASWQILQWFLPLCAWENHPQLLILHSSSGSWLALNSSTPSLSLPCPFCFSPFLYLVPKQAFFHSFIAPIISHLSPANPPSLSLSVSTFPASN